MSIVGLWLQRKVGIKEIDLLGAIKKDPALAAPIVGAVTGTLPIKTAVGTIIMEVAPTAMIQAESALTAFLDKHGLSAADPEAIALSEAIFGAFGITS